MKLRLAIAIVTFVSSTGIAQVTKPALDPLLEEEKAIAHEVEDHTHIKGFDFRSVAPRIRLDAGPVLSFYSWKDNAVREEHWEEVPTFMQGRFNEWAGYTRDEASGEQLYHDLFYRFFFVHELGHWMEEVVLKQRQDKEAKTADDNSDHNRWEFELDANRISVAWWRERDPNFIAGLVADLRIIQSKLPSPVPAGEDIKAFFASHYMKLTEDPNAYGWYQLQMILVAYDERPTMSFHQAILKLPAENYDE